MRRKWCGRPVLGVHGGAADAAAWNGMGAFLPERPEAAHLCSVFGDADAQERGPAELDVTSDAVLVVMDHRSKPQLAQVAPTPLDSFT